MLNNLEKYVDSYVSSLQFKSFLAEERTPHLEHLEGHPSTPPITPTPEWVKVGSGFDSIAAGFQGLVCATSIKDSNSLFIRMGVSQCAPNGVSWEKIIGETAQVAVGKDCIVRRTCMGDLYIANVREYYYNCTENLVPDWTPVNVYGLRQLIIQQQGRAVDESYLQSVIQSKHLLLDERDRLFIVAPSGVVYGCLEPYLRDESSTQWITVSRAPPIENPRPSIIYNLYSWFRGKSKENGGIFSQVCIGKGVLWCVRAYNCELWQLVLSDFITSGGATELRSNWSHVPIPAEDERISLLAASKSTVDGIYAVMVKNSNGHGVIVAYSLNQTGSGRVEVEPPSLGEPVCLVIGQTLGSAAANSTVAPSKPRRIGNDMCCENGDCSYCQNPEHSIFPRRLFPSPPDSRMEVEEPGSSSSILGKRPHPESNESSNESRPKRRHSDRYPRLDTYYYLLEGVMVQRNPQYGADDHPNVCRIMNIASGIIVLIFFPTATRPISLSQSFTSRAHWYNCKYSIQVLAFGYCSSYIINGLSFFYSTSIHSSWRRSLCMKILANQSSTKFLMFSCTTCTLYSCYLYLC